MKNLINKTDEEIVMDFCRFTFEYINKNVGDLRVLSTTLMAITKHLINEKLHDKDLTKLEMVAMIDECFEIEEVFSNHSNDNS